ncbi:GNAT family N-acetyltransferase [Hoeflea sp.]|uniref:GNAT family N-acetyltransferase n=1 Tax=Hoeflea sp. TaxID=1940281 RepID=UPI003BAE33B5
MKIDTEVLTDRLRIRTWTDSEADRAFFHRVNSDPVIMRFFPWQLGREEADEWFDEMMAHTAEVGFGWAVAENLETGHPVGFTGLAGTNGAKAAGADVETGWRYIPEVWGKGYASEAARALLSHGFNDLKLKRIVAFAVGANSASIAVMQRIGMTARPDLDFDHPAVPDTHPHLKRHVLYEMLAGDARL